MKFEKKDLKEKEIGKRLSFVYVVVLFFPVMSLIILLIFDEQSSKSEIVNTSAVVGLFSVAFYTFVFDSAKYLLGKTRKREDSDV